jgi:hypothetical protein
VAVLQKIECDNWGDKPQLPKYSAEKIFSIESRPIPPLKMEREACC